MALTGAYDRPVRLMNVGKGMVLWLLLFTLLRVATGMPVAWRLDLMAVLVLGLAPILSRLVMHLLGFKGYSLRSPDLERVLAIGGPDETQHALALLWQTHFGLGRQHRMSVAQSLAPDGATGIRAMIRTHDIDEVVFCACDLQWSRIIALIEQLRTTGVTFKIAQPNREFIIGPNSIESLADLYILGPFAVNGSAGRRQKRLLDLALVFILVLVMPVMLLIVRDRRGFLVNWWDVLWRRKSWVGYGPVMPGPLKLPTIRAGILDPTGGAGPQDPTTLHRANIAYAKDYKAWTDLRAVWSGLSRLGVPSRVQP
jgi:hypothetical protein